MIFLKILVVGLGSMGKRRIRLLKQKYENFNIVGVDNNEDRRKETEKKFNIETYNNLENAISMFKPDIVFACTSPLSHGEIIKYALSHDCDTFSEINLVKDNYDEIINLCKSKNKIAFLSSTMMYNDEIKYIMSRIDLKQNYTYRYHVGQYLPDWHPWESYNDFFVSNKRTNACREIMAIEFPWIIKTFGKVDEFYVIKDKKTKLNINYPDNYQIIFKHENGVSGNISIDVICRKPVRHLEIFSEEKYILWEGTPNSLKEYSKDNNDTKDVNIYSNIIKEKGYAETIVENEYINEIDAAIESISNRSNSIYTYYDDKYVLDLLDKIEE